MKERVRTIKEMMTLVGKNVLITGGTGWLGSALTEAALELGANVITVSRNMSERFIAQDKVGVSHITCDLTDPDEIDELSSKLGKVDVLVYNACRWPTTRIVSDDVWDGSIDTSTIWDDVDDMIIGNLSSLIALTKVIVGRHMDKGSNILNVASMYGTVSPDPKMYRQKGGNPIEYGAANAGIIQMTRWLAAHLARKDIRCNCISPGPFSRPGSLDGKQWFEDELKSRTMLSRIGAPYELKGAFALLTTELGSYMTGVNLPIDGGWTAW